MLRVLALAGGLLGAAGLSQFPEFSQQYLQRLSGAVTELRIVVTGFDLTARAAGKTREEALAELDREGFIGDLGNSIAGNIARFERLEQDYDALKDASALGRLAQPWNLTDSKVVQGTWEDFRPALPLTVDGALCAGVGFLLGWGLVSLLIGLLMWPVRRLGLA